MARGKPLDQLSPRYRARIERGIAKGKSRQAARGHVAREHVFRKEREREKYGIARSENDQIRNWYRTQYNAFEGEGKPSEDEVIDEATSNGYAWFQEFRKVWNAARREYVRALKAGTYASKGLQYLAMLTEMTSAPDINWLYYH